MITRLVNLVVVLCLLAWPVAAATTSHGGTWNDATDATSYPSGSFTPSADDLLIVVVAATATTIGAASISSSAGTTFTLVNSAVKNTSADILGMWVANSFSTNTSQTVTFDCASDGATGASITVWRIVGMLRTGASAIRQSGKTDNVPAFELAQVTGLTTTLTENVMLGAYASASNPADIGAPTSWTETNDSGFSPPTTGKQVAFRNSGHIATTVVWTNTPLTAFCVLAAELDTSAAAGGVPLRMLLGVGR